MQTTSHASSSRMLSSLHASSSGHQHVQPSLCGCSHAHHRHQLLFRRKLKLQRTTPQLQASTSSTAPSSSSPQTPAPVTSFPAKPAAKWGTGSPSTKQRAVLSESTAAKGKGAGNKRGGGNKRGDDDEGEKWGVLDWSRFEGWDVPWSGASLAGGMALWFGSFVAVGFLVVPGLYGAAGIKLSELPLQDKAQYVLVTQGVATVVGLSVIRLVTAKPMEEAGQPESPKEALFNYSPSAPFRKPYGWAFWGLLGLALAPLLVGTLATLLSSTGYEEAVGGKGTVDGVAGMIQLNTPTYLCLLSVTGVLAPILEETVFRGFLLTSLTKWLPTWAALGISSFAFGLCHLSPRDLPILTALGMLLGATYVRSRNLLSPILIHGAWNSTVLTLLFVLAQSGIDLNQALNELR